MADKMPTASFEALEATVTLRHVGSQVFVEFEGDCWSAGVTLDDAATVGINDWFTLYRMNR